MDKAELIDFYLDNGVLISPEMLGVLDGSPLPLNTKFSVIGKDSLGIINSRKSIVIEDFEKAIVLKEKHKDVRLYNRFISYINDVDFNQSTKQSMTPQQQTRQSSDFISPSLKDIHHNISPEAESSPNISLVPSSSSIKQVEHQESQQSTRTISIRQQPQAQVSSSENISAIHVSASTPVSIQVQTPVQDISSIHDISSSKEEKELFMKRNKIRVVSSYNSKVRKWSVHDFVSLYNARFKELEKILRSRQELSSLTSIARISQKKERENVALIGVVYEKAVTKAGNLMLTIEDPTGMIKVVVRKANEDLFRLAEETQLDEVIGIAGMFDQIIFASSILIPDIPLTKELKKSPDEGYFVVIADTEPGSKLFLEKEFDKLISWINGEIGNEKQREVAANIKYIFIAGDLVNGVGIYPGQEFDLTIIDIYDQYRALANILKRIPSHIPIFICPGNHDVGRISEPQPPIDEEYAKDLISMPNIISLSNPSTVNIYAQPENNFDGFDVMFYHGYSFIYYSENVPSIRKAGGQKRADMIMKYLLQRRHLAPSHTSTLYIPDPKYDPLVIDKVPDFLLTGHVHRAMVSTYKNVTCINASCWTAQSEEQERRGLEAQPGRAFIVNMHTREVKIMNFMPKDESEKELTSPAANTGQESSSDKSKSEAAQNG